MNLDLDLLKSRLFIIKKLQRNAIRAYSKLLGGRVLDAGCGMKPYKEYITCESYTGIDMSRGMAADAMASALQLPFADGAFDTVISSEVLEHVPEPQAAVNELFRVLKPGGVAYISAPMSWALHYEPHDYWRFTNYGLAHLLGSSGFKVIVTHRIGGIFSMVGQRSIDVLWSKIVSVFSFLGKSSAEKIATCLCIPLSIVAYGMALAGDRIDKQDALGWVMVARKQ